MMWLFPVEAFNAFRNIYILTYMFDAQIQRYYYDYYGLEYTHIYVKGNDVDSYEFTQNPNEATFSYCNYSKLIHILQDEKMNQIGDREYDLSKSWYERNKNNVAIKQLKNNITNFFINRRKSKTSDNIWTTYKEYRKYLTNKGYGRAFLPLSIRASNAYRTRTSIAYPVNRYLNTGIKNFFLKNDVLIDEDGYALSEMLQFIWRSAIRDDDEIWIYIPSVRMRNLLQKWLDNPKTGPYTHDQQVKTEDIKNEI